MSLKSWDELKVFGRYFSMEIGIAKFCMFILHRYFHLAGEDFLYRTARSSICVHAYSCI